MNCNTLHRGTAQRGTRHLSPHKRDSSPQCCTANATSKPTINYNRAKRCVVGHLRHGLWLESWPTADLERTTRASSFLNPARRPVPRPYPLGRREIAGITPSTQLGTNFFRQGTKHIAAAGATASQRQGALASHTQRNINPKCKQGGVTIAESMN
jgi:hypothetical protein